MRFQIDVLKRINKMVFVFLLCVLFVLLLLATYYYRPGIFGLHREGLKNEYYDSYKSCIENGGSDDFDEVLFNSYLRHLDRGKIESVSNDTCEEGSVECAERYLIIANQVSLSITTYERSLSKVREMADTALRLIGLAKRIVGDDLVIRASIELLVANLNGVGLEGDAREISKVTAYLGPAKSRYSCFYANNIYYSSIAYKLFSEGRYFDSIYILRGLLYRISD